MPDVQGIVKHFDGPMPHRGSKKESMRHEFESAWEFFSIYLAPCDEQVTCPESRTLSSPT